ncbi:MAG TPA: YihY/virulence factor BrkB family protein [Anaerolineales bacterium]
MNLFRQTFAEWSEDKAPRLAAALSYYTIFSLAPLLVIVIAIAGLAFGKSTAQNQIVGQITSLVGKQGADAIQAMIAGASNPKTSLIATIIGFITLILGAAGVFGQLQDSMNTIWEVAPKPGRGIKGILQDRLLSFAVVLVIGFLLLVSLVISTVISAFSQFASGLLPFSGLMPQLINLVVSFIVITLLFALTFKYLPDVSISWRDVWLGAAFTALLFTIGKWLIGLYLGRSAFNSTYGAAGSLVVVLLWIYYSAQILFFGAEFTQVYGKRFGTEIKPNKNAVPLTEEARAQQGIPRKEAVTVVAAGKATSVEVAAQGKPELGPRPVRPQSEYLAEAQPSVLALSAVLAALVGFVSGMVVNRGGPR